MEPDEIAKQIQDVYSEGFLKDIENMKVLKNENP